MLTAIAIVLGVALVSGTYVLTDSITKAFDSIFQTIYQNTDATITGRNALDTTRTTWEATPPPRRSTSRCS